MSLPLRWNSSAEGCAEQTDILKNFLETFAAKTWKSSENFSLFWYKGNMNSKTHSLGWKPRQMLVFGSLILQISWLFFMVSNFITFIFTSRQMDKVDYKEPNWVISGCKTRLLGNRKHGSGLTVLIFMKNSPWDMRLLRYPKYKKFIVDLEQPLGGNMTKALEFISIKLPKSIQIRFFSLNLHLISMNREAGKREKQACPSNTGKTRPPCSTTPGLFCPSITLTNAFCHPLRPTDLQGTDVILKIYGHRRHFVVTVHHAHLVL